MGATKKQVVVDEEDDSTSIKRMTCFSMTINHAAVDGLHSAPYLLTLGKLLKDPESYMGIK
jgi:pyruvate/2-oxoglutarate dehydrogenase complex dihydrolipoamide acyltransferase (E2) component